MLKPLTKNRFAIKKDHEKRFSKTKYQFPVIQRCTLDIYQPQKNYSQNSLHRQSKILRSSYGNLKSSKRNLSQQLQSKFKDKAKENQMKMERSINRFLQKENYFNRTLLQKKKQKKIFGIENLQNQQIDFFKSAARDNLLKQETAQDDILNHEVPLNVLPNTCYDSPFIFQREGSCLTILNNKLYLFGGALRRKIYFQSQNSEQSNTDILFHSYEDDRWVREPVANQVSNDKKNLIHHTVNAINKKHIVIAGGMIGDSHKTLSKFNDSILLYNTQTKKIQEIQCNFRIRSHSSASFQNNVILHGGMSDAGYIASELYILGLNSSNSSCPIKISRYETNEGRAHHQMISTLGEDKNFKINLRENNGIYMFGGQDSNGKLNGQLQILKIYTSSDFDRKGVKNFETIKTLGEGPCPRKNHSMSLVAKKNCLVIIGGLDANTNPLSDVWLIQLCQLSWRKIETSPNIDLCLGGIYKQATAFNNKNIYILGGRYLKDVGKQNFWKLDFSLETYDKIRTKQRKYSKLSSCWSIGHQLGQSDKLVYND